MIATCVCDAMCVVVCVAVRVAVLKNMNCVQHKDYATDELFVWAHSISRFPCNFFQLHGNPERAAISGCKSYAPYNYRFLFRITSLL